MEQLQLREKEIFETLKKLQKRKFVVIGGYAVNAYTLPRFSVDCDIVINDKEELFKIIEELSALGYNQVKDISEATYDGKFERYEKEISPNFVVSVDILIEEVLDRQTNSKFFAWWVFDNSKIRVLKGKTINEQLNIRIIDSDALFVMKFLSCRTTDIRDIFLLANMIKNKPWIKKEISDRYDFKNRFSKIKKEVTSKQFKDNLQGVFGLVDNTVFERNKKLILEFGK